MIAYPGAKHNSKLQPSAAQIPPGDAGRVVTDLLRGAEGHDPPAGISAADLATALAVLDRVRDNLSRIDREDRGEPSSQS